MPFNNQSIVKSYALKRSLSFIKGLTTSIINYFLEKSSVKTKKIKYNGSRGYDMRVIIDSEKVLKTLKRITHEIIERNDSLENLVLVGIKEKGIPIANKLKEYLKEVADANVQVFELDISDYRDDVPKKNPKPQSIKIDKKCVIIVDDVLYTGRTVRAAMDALVDYGRPLKIQLAVLVDRGHRELPIRADYVGKNIPTSNNEKIFVDTKEFTVNIA